MDNDLLPVPLCVAVHLRINLLCLEPVRL